MTVYTTVTDELGNKKEETGRHLKELFLAVTDETGRNMTMQFEEDERGELRCTIGSIHMKHEEHPSQVKEGSYIVYRPERPGE